MASRPNVNRYTKGYRDAGTAISKYSEDLANWCNSEGKPSTDNECRPTSSEINEINTAYDNKTQTSGGGSGSGGFIQTVTGGISAIAKTQELSSYPQMPTYEDETFKVSELTGQLFDESTGKLKELDEIGKIIIEKAFEQVETYLEQQTVLLDRVNNGMKLTGQFSKDFRDELTETNPYLLRMGISFDDLVDAAEDFNSEIGLFRMNNRDTWVEAAKAAKAYVGDLDDVVDMLPEFQDIGLGARDAIESIKEAGSNVMKLGVNSKNVTKELGSSISKLNEYGFKGGIDGLTTMIKKSIEFRMSMSEVFKIADKVMNPEGALELAANLQVLGGAIGDFNDPLKMMYMATNNVEGLQDSLIDAAQSLATYNEEQGRFEITGVNLRRAKEMANQLGISYDELAKGAIAAAERTSAAADMMAAGLTLEDEQTEFLTNLAQMKDGKMTIEVSDRMREILGLDKDTKEIALENLTQTQAEQLLAYQDELRTKTDEEIIRGQATDIENINRDVSFLAGLARIQAGRLGETVYQETVGKFVKQGAGQIDQFADGAGDQIDAYGKKIRDKVETTINNVTTTNNANNPNNPLTAQELTDAFTNGYVNGSRIISNGRPSTSNNSPFSNNSMSNSLIRRDYIFGSDFEIKDN